VLEGPPAKLNHGLAGTKRRPTSLPTAAYSRLFHRSGCANANGNLIDPIRPPRRHSTISPHSGLYALSSLCGSA